MGTWRLLGGKVMAGYSDRTFSSPETRNKARNVGAITFHLLETEVGGGLRAAGTTPPACPGLAGLVLQVQGGRTPVDAYWAVS